MTLPDRKGLEESDAALGTNSDPCDPFTIGPNDRNSGYIFGKSSAASFVHSLKRTIARDEDGVIHRATQNNKSVGKGSAIHMNRMQPTQPTGPTAFSLPVRKDADRYMYCFWQYVHTVAPILHKPSFISSYRSLWVSKKELGGDRNTDIDDPLFLATLSIVFALGCQYDETIEPIRKTVLIERFYIQSRTLSSPEELDSVSLLTVQFLLLSGLYLSTLR